MALLDEAQPLVVELVQPAGHDAVPSVSGLRSHVGRTAGVKTQLAITKETSITVVIVIVISIAMNHDHDAGDEVVGSRQYVGGSDS